MGTAPRVHPSKMILSISLTCLLAVASAAPQVKTDFLRKLVDSPQNPCGQGIEATCTRGSCECPNGISFTAGEILELIRGRILNSPANPCGPSELPSCTCKDGSEAPTWTGKDLSNGICEGSTPRDRLPASCSCTISGKSLDPVVFAKSVANTLHSLANGQAPDLIDRLALHTENPCGVGVIPVCSQGQCTCPNGDLFNPAAILEKIREKLVNGKGNPCGAGNEPQCICGNGEVANVWDGRDPTQGVCEGNTRQERFPTTCSCPDGKSLDPRKMIQGLLRQLGQLRGVGQQ